MKQKPPVHSNENHISHPNKLEVFYLTKFTSWIYLPFISGIITADQPLPEPCQLRCLRI